MIVLAPISPLVQDTLYQKIAMLGAGAGKTVGKDENEIWTANNTTANASAGENAENYMFARTPYMVMTSLTPTDEGGPLIIQGGELNSFGQMAGKFDTITQDFFETSDYDWSNDRGSKYTGYGSELQMPLRPLAGVKDIAIEYKGGGMKLGATREATINWSCWSWEELERLTSHFLAPRRSVFLEWGWSGIGELGRGRRTFDLYQTNRENGLHFDVNKVMDLNSKLSTHIQQQAGHYDAMLGLITSFDWSVNESGGFECNTVLIGQGVSILQSQQKGNKYAKFESMGLLGPREDANKTDFMTGDENEKEKLGMWQQILKERSPYITFREYMSDFRQQVKFSILRGDENQPIIQIPSCENLKGIIKQTTKNGTPYPAYPEGKSGEMYFGFIPEDQYFCSWGWFEDNVLSRFFGKVTKRGGKDVILSEFRSITQKVDLKGNLIKKTNGKPLNQANRFRGSKYLITIDSTKWLIPNPLDPMFKYLKILSKSKYFLMHTKYNNENTPFEIRDIMFNAGYLSEKLKGSSDIVRSVLSVWDEFSKLYGGVYKFKTEFDDINSRLSLVEEGYSNFNVEGLLEGVKQKEIEKPQPHPQLFVFPAMENGSIVKTQTLNARLPDRMKLAAMYGVKSPTPKEQEETDYDKLSASAWGTLSSTKPSDTTEMTETEKQKKRYDDYMTGKIDFPSRGNRDFGERYANIDNDIFIGEVPLGKDIYGAKYGTTIRVSILDDLDQTQQDYLKKRKGQESVPDAEAEEELNATDTEKLIENFNDNFSFSVDDKSVDNYYAANWKETNHKVAEVKLETTVVESDTQPQGPARKPKDYNGSPDWTWLQEAIDMGIYNHDIVGNSEIYPKYFSAGYKQHFRAIIDHDDLSENDMHLVELQKEQAEEMMVDADPPPVLNFENVATTKTYDAAVDEESDGYAMVAAGGENVLAYQPTGTVPSADAEPDPNAVALSVGQSNMDTTLFNPEEDVKQANEEFYHYAYISLKPELIYELQKKLRGDPENGIIPKTNPLIPVDFEMEIDGTGGMFPGNSFHSSYFSSRYKEESLFQMVGVNHTIDSSGWSTTIKGQIRSVARAGVVESVELAKETESDNESSENQSGDTGDTDIQGAKEENPFVGITLGKSNIKAKDSGLKKFWWTNEPGVYSSGDDTRSNGRGDSVELGETGEVAAW